MTTAITIEVPELAERGSTVRDLAYEQRAVWGKCPVCKAEHGKECAGNDGEPLRVHLGRLERAPLTITITV